MFSRTNADSKEDDTSLGNQFCAAIKDGGSTGTLGDGKHNKYVCFEYNINNGIGIGYYMKMLFALMLVAYLWIHYYYIFIWLFINKEYNI